MSEQQEITSRVNRAEFEGTFEDEFFALSRIEAAVNKFKLLAPREWIGGLGLMALDSPGDDYSGFIVSTLVDVL